MFSQPGSPTLEQVLILGRIYRYAFADEKQFFFKPFDVERMQAWAVSPVVVELLAAQAE